MENLNTQALNTIQTTENSINEVQCLNRAAAIYANDHQYRHSNFNEASYVAGNTLSMLEKPEAIQGFRKLLIEGYSHSDTLLSTGGPDVLVWNILNNLIELSSINRGLHDELMDMETALQLFREKRGTIHGKYLGDTLYWKASLIEWMHLGSPLLRSMALNSAKALREMNYCFSICRRRMRLYGAMSREFVGGLLMRCLQSLRRVVRGNGVKNVLFEVPQGWTDGQVLLAKDVLVLENNGDENGGDDGKISILDQAIGETVCLEEIDGRFLIT